MPGKQRTPAPIDRPLSRAYLREFSGWSTAYPPGASEPTSLRIMENLQINRDGSVRVRPGMRYMSYLEGGLPTDLEIVGSHEAFFLNDGSKAYLVAVRELDDTVGFRVLANTGGGTGLTMQGLSAVGVDFALPADPATLNFTSATTYVKYLQIDNKVFALSNAGEAMRLFYVGANKSAKSLASIEKPEWSVADKLSVVHPEAAWITSGAPTSVRTNLLTNPNFETNVAGWTADTYTKVTRSDTVGAQEGSYAMRIESRPARSNLIPYTLKYPVANLNGWSIGSGGGYFTVDTTPPTYPGWARRQGLYMTWGYCNSPLANVEEGRYYIISYDIHQLGGAADIGCLYRFFSSGGAVLYEGWLDWPNTVGRMVSPPLLAPSGAVSMQIYPAIRSLAASHAPETMWFGNVMVSGWGESASYFDGDSGTDYLWEGGAGASASFYHPPQDVAVASTHVTAVDGEDYTGSLYIRAGSTVRQAQIVNLFYDAANAFTGADYETLTDDTAGWIRRTLTTAAPAATVQAALWLTIKAVPRGEYHYIDAAMFEQASAVGTYFDGNTTSTSTSLHAWTGAAHGSSSTESALSSPATIPSPETKTANTLIGSGTNTYNFGFFYDFANEVGESAASQVTVVKTQRGWSQWKWETANGSGEPSGTDTADPILCADQLVAIVPQAVFNQAIAQGATSWKLYMLTWSDQDPVPVTAVKIAERPLDPASLYGSAGWLAATPQQADATAEISGLPNQTTRYNYSNPSRGGQGIVAADRMVLVNDPTAQAVIRWSSNQQGSYTDFTANKGGGYKTLTSGNLFIPACVKLWQNPQSVDTLTILCLGTDGHSTGYYMAPAQVAQQSEATNVMGFEESTATPGTTSPYGCEVLNNALYHPLDEQLMKSTATNYNINHSSMTDAIQNSWRKLAFKQRIVSSTHDNRLYYLVHNPAGEALEAGCWGNEIWVLDAAQKQGTWSRWLVQGQSLRKIELGGKGLMALVRPDGIYYFDEDYASDDYVDAGAVATRSIAWSLESNTQGANRAHDAWAHLQQANIQLGYFQGQLRYGIKGYDLHGKPVDISKIVRDSEAAGAEAWDLEDNLLIRRDMKEWFFYAESVTEDDVVQPSAGQITLVQYRYTPSTVNTGYEFGSVETFEYGRAGNAADQRTTDNGVPMPYIDTRRP